MRHAAELHDIGKVAIPDSIVDEARPARRRRVGVHAAVTRSSASGSSPRRRRSAPVGELVRSSHERYDGRGYPDGLAGEDIPLGARIIAVCDAFDAMLSDRPYSPAQAGRRGARRAAPLLRHAVRPRRRRGARHRARRPREAFRSAVAAAQLAEHDLGDLAHGRGVAADQQRRDRRLAPRVELASGSCPRARSARAPRPASSAAPRRPPPSCPRGRAPGSAPPRRRSPSAPGRCGGSSRPSRPCRRSRARTSGAACRPPARRRRATITGTVATTSKSSALRRAPSRAKPSASASR